MGRIDAVVTDLDGTFWWGPDHLHPTTLEAVRALRDAGIALLFATGRRYTSAHRALDPLGLCGPAVLLSGAIGTDMATGEEWHRQAFAPDAGLAVLEAFEDEGLGPVVHVSSSDLDAAVGEGCATSPTHLRGLGDPDPVDLRALVAGGQVVGFGVCGIDPSRAPAAERAARRIGDAAVVWAGPDHVMGGWTVMVGPAGVSKVTGIQGWADTHGVTADRVMAVGDGSNDLEMLAWAGTSVAVAGGAAEAAGADHVIVRPQDGGWATILDLL